MKRQFLDNVLGPKCGKLEVDFFQKLGLGLGLGSAIQVVKKAIFDGPDGVQGWESDEKRIFGQSFCSQSVEKWTFFKS